jgi:hypothetical protein
MAATGHFGIRQRVSGKPRADPGAFDNSLRIAVTAFLQHPAVAIRV